MKYETLTEMYNTGKRVEYLYSEYFDKEVVGAYQFALDDDVTIYCFDKNDVCVAEKNPCEYAI